MGAWGPGIFSDDTAADVRDDFKQLIGDGLDAEEATRRLLEQWADTVADPDEGAVFWLALAATQASMGRLQDAVRDRAVEVIDVGADLRRWEEDADPADLRKRRANLEKLRAELVGPQKAPTKVRKEYVEVTEWVPGQHWAYRLASGRWIVLRVTALDEKLSRGVLPVVEVLAGEWAERPTLHEAGQAEPRHHLGYGYSLDDDSRPADALIVTRWSQRDFPADRLVLLGHAQVGEPKPKKARLFGRSRGRRPQRIPHLTWWKHLDTELAEHWQVT